MNRNLIFFVLSIIFLSCNQDAKNKENAGSKNDTSTVLTPKKSIDSDNNREKLISELNRLSAVQWIFKFEGQKLYFLKHRIAG